MTQERPILVSGAMMRALLAGRTQPSSAKTQTRRVVKPQPDIPFDVPNLGAEFIDGSGRRLACPYV